MSAIRVFRVTISDHSTLFDDYDAASGFVKGVLKSRENVTGAEPLQVCLESVFMEEDEYRGFIETEDGVVVRVENDGL